MMKRILMFAILTSVINFFTGCTGTILFKQGYNISGNKVYFKNAFPGNTFEIEKADTRSFKIVIQPGMSEDESNKYFATDQNNVYYYGYPLDGSDGKTFTVITKDFAKDKNQCYYHGNIIPGSDPASFTVRDQTFSTDKNNVYKGEMAMDHSSSLFESFDSSTVVHTANAVSVFQTIIPLLPGAKFKFLKFNYYAIDAQVYFHDRPMPDADIESFSALNDFFSKTAQHVYYADKIITDADPETYQLLPSPFAKDDKHIFFFEKTIEGADPETFEILNINFQCSRDKHWAYHEDKRIKHVTPQDMANNKPCRQCNEESIYFEEK